MKKGISPLIATVLIIGLTILLFSLAMNWQKILIRGITDSSQLKGVECSKISFEVYSACYQQSTGDILIRLGNTANIEIPGFEFTISGETSTQFAPTPPFIVYKPGGDQTISIPYVPTLIGPIKEIEITPKVKLDRRSYICEDQSKVLIDIPTCLSD